MAKKEEKSKKRRGAPRLIRVPVNCIFCTRKIEPDYKDYRTLMGYLTDRAKIIGNARSGVCSKHQRYLTVAIKRARHLGLLPFTPSL